MSAVLEIPDAKSVPHRYLLTDATSPAPWQLRTLAVLRLDSGDSYRLTEVAPNVWECSCPAYRYGRMCKHQIALETIMLEDLEDNGQEDTGTVANPKKAAYEKLRTDFPGFEDPLAFW